MRRVRFIVYTKTDNGKGKLTGQSGSDRRTIAASGRRRRCLL